MCDSSISSASDCNQTQTHTTAPESVSTDTLTRRGSFIYSRMEEKYTDKHINAFQREFTRFDLQAKLVNTPQRVLTRMTVYGRETLNISSENLCGITELNNLLFGLI